MNVSLVLSRNLNRSCMHCFFFSEIRLQWDHPLIGSSDAFLSTTVKSRFAAASTILFLATFWCSSFALLNGSRERWLWNISVLQWVLKSSFCAWGTEKAVISAEAEELSHRHVIFPHIAGLSQALPTDLRSTGTESSATFCNFKWPSSSAGSTGFAVSCYNSAMLAANCFCKDIISVPRMFVTFLNSSQSADIKAGSAWATLRFFSSSLVSPHHSFIYVVYAAVYDCRRWRNFSLSTDGRLTVWLVSPRSPSNCWLCQLLPHVHAQTVVQAPSPNRANLQQQSPELKDQPLP